MVKQAYVWDFTLNSKGLEDYQVINTLNELSKEWKMQLERGDTGYIHYQGRMSLFKKRRESELIGIINQTDMRTAEVSPTSNNGLVSNYCCKLDTRIRGPWTNESELPPYIPRQIREIEKLYPWQQRIVDNVEKWDTRTINIIYDNNGNIGKSTLVGYMRCKQLGRKIPACNDYKDVMRMVCDMPTSSCYLIDLPRAMKKEKLSALFSAIEEIKSGYAYDDRYKFKEKFFDCPNIWVFTNNIPNKEYLSEDRWKIWQINKWSKQLEEYEEEEDNNYESDSN